MEATQMLDFGDQSDANEDPNPAESDVVVSCKSWLCLAVVRYFAIVRGFAGCCYVLVHVSNSKPRSFDVYGRVQAGQLIVNAPDQSPELYPLRLGEYQDDSLCFLLYCYFIGADCKTHGHMRAAYRHCGCHQA